MYGEENGPGSSFCTLLCRFPRAICFSFPPWIFFPALWKISWLYSCGSISGGSVLSYSSVCVRACVRVCVCVCFEPVPNILNTSALYYILKSGIGMPPVSTSIFIRIFFFCLFRVFWGFLPILVLCVLVLWGLLLVVGWDCTQCVDCFGQYGHFSMNVFQSMNMECLWECLSIQFVSSSIYYISVWQFFK